MTKSYTSIDELSSLQAKNIINRMRGGTTPIEAAHLIDHGREKWYAGMDYFFDGAESEEGLSQVRFIRGKYGDGKTHLMSMAMFFALKRNFLVSYASAEDTELHKFDQIYRKLVINLQSKNGKNGIEQILNEWKSQNIDNINVLIKKLKENPFDINFRTALQGFLQTDSLKVEDQIIRWFLGENIKIKEIGILSPVSIKNSREMLRSLSILIKDIMGYSGFLILLDELDRVQNQSRPIREKIYNNLRQLLDNVDGRGGMRGTITYIAAPSEMYTREKGFREYNALDSRIGQSLSTLNLQKNPDYRGIIINLETTPLTKEDLFSMAKKVRDIHGIAEQYDARGSFPDQDIEKIIDYIVSKDFIISMPRLVATTITLFVEMKKAGTPVEISNEVQNAVEICVQNREITTKSRYKD